MTFRFRARPEVLYDLDEKHEPLGPLVLGGNADLYVLYDPCVDTVRLGQVGSSRVELIDRVDCRPPQLRPHGKYLQGVAVYVSGTALEAAAGLVRAVVTRRSGAVSASSQNPRSIQL